MWTCSAGFPSRVARVSLSAMSRLLTESQITETLDRMARDIVAALPADAPLAVVGIRRRGETLARRLLPLLEKHGTAPAHFGVLDITLYRDDLTAIGPAAVVRGTELDFDLTDTWLVLVDDVLYTGRSVRAALNALTDFGRARAVKLAVLIDRGGRELPVCPDFTGLSVEATPEQVVEVRLLEHDGIEGVELNDRPA